jgi:peptide/nickel transport system ATP-binding protein
MTSSVSITTDEEHEEKTNTKNVLQVKNLDVRFLSGGKEIRAVEGVDLSLRSGEALGLVGESGCGKSTLAYAIIRLLPRNARVTSGSILLDGEELLSKTEKKMREIRGSQISMVFQDPQTSLNPVFKVKEQIGRVVMLHQKVDKREAYKRSVELLKLVELADQEVILDSYPHQLSGGMQQRIMVAMALALKPKLMIADEPTTAVDATIQAQILRLLKKLNKELGFSLMLITHNLGIVAEICDVAAVMYAGRIVEISSAQTLFRNPQHPYTKGLLSTLPVLDPLIDRSNDLPTIGGNVPDLSNLPKGCKFNPRCPHVMPVCINNEPRLMETESKHLVSCYLYDPNLKGQ